MEKINVCFSFDGNYISQAKAGIASLLWASHGKVHYNFYMLVDDNVKKHQKNLLRFLKKRDAKSSYHFVYRGNTFSTGVEVRGISTSTYYRLLLHQILPDVDKVIYSDLDVIFYRDLSSIWNTNMNGACIAGVKATFNLKSRWDDCCKKLGYWEKELGDCQGKYIQAGILLMDLNKIRQLNVDVNKVKEMSEKNYHYVDQDIINILFKNKISYLPPKCNFFAPISDSIYDTMGNEQIYTREEIEEARKDFIMCHYAGEKPWNNYRVARSEYWLDFIKSDRELSDLFFRPKGDEASWNFYRYADNDFTTMYSYLKKQMRRFLGYKPNLVYPKTFNEKINWLKLYYSNSKQTVCADKYLVRNYIEKTIGEQYLIPLIGAWDHVDDIDFDQLPEKFVLKVNWGSGQNIICQNKKDLNILTTKQKLRRWILPSHNHYFYSYENAYKKMKPKIIAEKYIEHLDDLLDYKIMCFNGKPELFFICSERATGLKVTFFDMLWNKLPFTRKYPQSTVAFKKPKAWDKMVALAEKLSKGFPFVRVDFYCNEDKLYFGELTFFPGAGLEPFEPLEWDRKTGDFLSLPKPNQNILFCLIYRLLFLFKKKNK